MVHSKDLDGCSRGGSSFLKRGGQSLNNIGYSTERNVVSDGGCRGAYPPRKFLKEISIKGEYFKCSKQKITLIVWKNISALTIFSLRYITL